MDDYQNFLKAKVKKAEKFGFDVGLEDVNPLLKPHQKDSVVWAVQGGRRALFEAFGLGKTIMQLETVRLTRERAGGMGLIVMPLGVRQEFVRDAGLLRIHVKFIRRIEEASDPNGIYLTNYETIRDGKMNPQHFSVASLDEASCLRGFGGTKTFREFMALFAGDRKTLNDRTASSGVRYRFVATATPSPNDYIELLAYAAYLGIMDVSAAKTRFFKRDSTKADHLTLHPHKKEEFWLWVSSWALFVQKPSDLGYENTGYDLPEMSVHWHEVETDHSKAGKEKDGQIRMFCNAAIGIQDSSKEKRNSLTRRIENVRRIVLDLRHKSTTKGDYCGGSDRVQQGILPEESRTSQRACKSVVRSEQGQDRQGEKEGISQRIQQNSCSKVPIHGTEGYLQPEASGEICERSRIQGAPKGFSEELSKQYEGESKAVETEGEFWNYNGGLQSNSCKPERGLCNLRQRSSEQQENELSICGSRPCYRKYSGSPLQQVQPRNGTLPGQSGSSHESSGLSDQIVIWCDLNDEQKAIEKMLKDEGVSFSSLYGSQSIEERETILQQWRNKETTVFLSKPVMYAAGINMQQCHTMIFAGINYKFYSVIQGIHRVHRFLQDHRCDIHFIFSQAERGIKKQLEIKWSQHNEMVEKMTEIIKEYGLSMSGMIEHLTRAMGVNERIVVEGKRYRLVNNDCVVETRSMDPDSVHLILTSIPFSTQYEYSPNFADFGHTDNNAHFWQQMDYIIPELYRVLQPGRVAAIHVKDRIVPGGMTGLGFQIVYPFHMDCHAAFVKHGFGYLGMKTIVTDVVRENNQTYRLGWTEQCKDGTKMGVGMPEYLLLFRKPPTDTTDGYADVPVVKSKRDYSRSRWQIDAHGFGRSSGERLMDPEELKSLTHQDIFRMFRDYSLTDVYDFEHHVKIGETLDLQGRLPVTFMLLQPQSWSDEVWTDITRMLTLNGAQSACGKQMHLCPMQFDLADRVIEQMSMRGEVVYDPFGGLMTVPYRAVLKGRFGLGCELSLPYLLDGAAYCKSAEIDMDSPTLFDAIRIEKEREKEAA